MSTITGHEEVVSAAAWLYRGAECRSMMAFHSCEQAASHLDRAAILLSGDEHHRARELAIQCRTAISGSFPYDVDQARDAVAAFVEKLGPAQS